MIRMRKAVLAAIGAAVVLVGLPTDARSDTPPPDLSVVDALAFATPVGLVTRIPNQLDGGVLYSRSSFTLDKSQATVAAVTVGELGEAFLETTVVAPPAVPAEIGQYVKYKNPTLATAQFPPSPVFPSNNSVAKGGLTVTTPFEISAASLTSAADAVQAKADAVGGARFRIPGVVTVQHAGSSSDSHVEQNGTVVAESHSYLSGIQIANVLTIGGIESTARVTSKPGAKPTKSLQVTVTGASIAGIAVSLTPEGIKLADNTVLGKAQLDTINKALALLDKGNVSIRLFPGIEEKADDRSASVAGSALSVRYDATGLVPTAVDTPVGPVGSPLGDVGKDEEILLGQVRASALGVARAPTPAVAGESVDNDDFGNLVDFAGDLGVPTPSVGAPLAVVPLDRGLELARTKEPPGVKALRSGYGLVLLCAFSGVAVLLAVRRRASNI